MPVRRKLVVDRLRALGVDHLDLLVISHRHIDHYGGADDVVKAFPPKVFLAPTGGQTSPTWLRLLTDIRDRGIAAISPGDQPRTIELGSVTLTVLPKAPPDAEEENNNSIGLRVRFGKSSVLLTGDSEEPERAYWERRCPALLADCAVLKLAHHGSRNGTDANWLALVKPKLAVASLGAGNKYGHPHPETLALLARLGIPLKRTDRDGTVILVTDGQGWKIEQTAAMPRAPPSHPATVPATTSPATGAPKASGTIDLNTASPAELEALPGIGPALARRIIDGRPYRSVEDLDRVKGIGPKTLEKLRPLVRVGR